MHCRLRRHRSRVGHLLSAAIIAIGVAGCASSPHDRFLDGPTVEGTPPFRRLAAEWEPVIGVMVRWPAYLPHELLIELAKDTTLHVLVEDAATARDAQRWFDRWSMPRDRVVFHHIAGSDDAQWPRDYGPHPVFTENGTLILADARYDKSTPDSGLACDAPLLTPWNGGWGDRFRDYDVTKDDAAPRAIARALGHPALELEVVLTGGNVMTDGRGGAMSCCIVTNENRSNGVADDAFFSIVNETLGIDRYDILPNFEDDGIQHIDCLLKLLDQRRMLVARPPADHPLSARYDAIVRDDLSALRTATGEPFEILRIDTARYDGEQLAAYTNALIVNDTVYVPLFDIAQDRLALQQWQRALPGHTIKGFRYEFDDEPVVPDRARRMYPGGIGWRSFDALHCRTRAVWDPNMLYLSVDPPPARPDDDGHHVVTARIIPYSGEPLLADETRLYWRLHDATEWNVVPLTRGDDGCFRAVIPAHAEPSRIEYYVTATDRSGRRESSPRTAPLATHEIVLQPGESAFGAGE